jgi:hypothetical protein
MYGIRDTDAGQKYYDSLLQLYASWGVDFIKCDDICATGPHPRKYDRKHEVEMLHKAIEKCGRPIVLSLSPGPAAVEESWHYSRYANMWRITDDFWDDWKALLDMFDRCEKWQDHVRPGCWPDCDMLPLCCIGKHFGQERSTNFTPDEQKTMMTLWCIFGSPLMLGAELTLLDDGPCPCCKIARFYTCSAAASFPGRCCVMRIPACGPPRIQPPGSAMWLCSTLVTIHAAFICPLRSANMPSLRAGLGRRAGNGQKCGPVRKRYFRMPSAERSRPTAFFSFIQIKEEIQ